jgi:hypothetical protein
VETEHKAADPLRTRGGHGQPEARRASRRWVPVVAVAVVVISVASAAYSLSRPSIPDEIEGLIIYGELPSVPVDGPVAYSQTPPAGGQHALSSLECGLYFEPVEDEKAVAALATGAVWVAYNPSVSVREIDDLELFGEGESDVFMAPYPDLPQPYVLTAWGVQLYPDSATDPRIASFIRDYKNAGSAPYRELSCHAEQSVP